MDRIEIIGASYVGKSTIYKELELVKKPSDKFITEKEAIALTRKAIGYPKLLLLKLKQLLIRLIGGDFDLHNRERYLNDKFVLEQYKYTLTLCYDHKGIKLTNLKLAYKTYNKLLRMISSYSYYDTLSTNKYIVVEESIIHWHLILHELLLSTNFNSLNDITSDKGIFPEAIICCYASEETILKRIQLRSKENQINKNHKGKDPQEILKQVLRKQSFFMNYSKMVQNKGGNVLYINTENDLKANATMIEAFINELN